MPNYPIRKTKNGTVVDVRFRIVDDNGIEVQKRLCGYPTKRAAQQAYLEFMKTYSPPALKVQKAKSYLFDDLWKVYRKKKETELAASSFYDLNWIFEKFLSPCFSGKSLTELKKSDYAEWQTELWANKNPKTGVYYTQKCLTKIRSTLLTFGKNDPGTVFSLLFGRRKRRNYGARRGGQQRKMFHKCATRQKNTRYKLK